MALFGGIQRRDLPGQIVVPDPALSFVNAHRHNPPRRQRRCRRSHPKPPGLVQKVWGTADLEIEREYAKQVKGIDCDLPTRR
jgi:hypothetical protein